MLTSESVGVVIRAQAVEVAVVERGLPWEQPRLLRQARVPFAPAEPPQEHDAAVAQAIREALAACQISSGSKVAVAVPSKEVLLRCFTLPLLPRAEWEQAVSFEARKYIPFKIDQLVWSYAATPLPKSKQLDIVFAGMRHETFARIQGWLGGAGVKAGLLESISGSLARAVGRRAGEAFVAVVDLEPETTHVTIVKGGVPYLSREVSLNDAAETEAKRVELLASELRLSLDFFAREHAGPPAAPGTAQAGAVVTRVLLFGDEPVVADWGPRLAEHVGCAVEPGPMPARTSMAGDSALGFAAAAGAALGRPGQGAGRLEFVGRAKPRVKMKMPGGLPALDAAWLRALVRPLTVQTAVALLVVGSVWGWTRQQISTAQARYEQTMRAFPDAGWGLAQDGEAELEALKGRLEARRAMVDALVYDRLFLTEKLNALALLMPEGVWLDGVDYRDPLDARQMNRPTLALRGACFLGGGDEVRAISGLVQRLKGDAGLFRGFDTAQVAQMLQQSDPGTQASYRTFQLNCQSKRRL